MTSSLLRRGLTLASAGAIALGGAFTLAPAAHAAATFTSFSAGGGSFQIGSSCTQSNVASTESSPAWSDNGATVPGSGSRTSTYSDGTNLTDVSGSAVGTVTATPITGGPARVTLSGTASASARPRTTSGTCDVTATGSLSIGADVTLPGPTWVTVTAVGSGPATTDVGGGINFGAYFSTGGTGTVTLRKLVPAGVMRPYASIEADARVAPGSTQAVQTSVSGTVVFDLQPIGNASAPTGRASRLVPLGLRDCASNTVAAVVTSKTAKRAKLVVVRVNGTKVVSLKGKKLRKRSFALPVAASAPATVTTTVVLKKGAKRLTGTRSYLACAE